MNSLLPPMVSFAEATPHSHKLPSTDEISDIDRKTVKAGTPALELMERAGKAIFKLIKAKSPKQVVVLAGPGNNGGDGLVVARLLHSAGIPTQVILASASRYSSELVENLKLGFAQELAISVFGGDDEKLGDSTISSITPSDFSAAIQESTMVIDALLGTGQSAAPHGSVGRMIQILNESLLKQSVISIDIPTGVSGDTGEVFDPFIKASQTIAIELVKRGLVQQPALEICGRIETVSIGLDTSLPIEFGAVSPREVAPLFKRKGGAHKGNFGHVLVIGGSRDMPGAPWLAATGALRAGAGLVTKIELKSIREEWRGKSKDQDERLNEIMLIEIEDRGRGYLVVDNLENLELEKFSSIVVGPGLGQRAETAGFLVELLGALYRSKTPTIIDADALNLISQKPSSYKLRETSIITPHPGEAARLLGRPTTEIQRDRYASARDLVDLTGATTVLKGASTVIHDGNEGRVVLTGNPFMATAGSGDILAGVIAAIAAFGTSPLSSASAGAYLHGLAGDLAHGVHHGPIAASDIAKRIPEAIGECREHS